MEGYTLGFWEIREEDPERKKGAEKEDLKEIKGK